MTVGSFKLAMLTSTKLLQPPGQQGLVMDGFMGQLARVVCIRHQDYARADLELDNVVYRDHSTNTFHIHG